MLKESIELQRQGRIDEAEAGYRAQLAAQPDDVDALHLLGMLRCQRGDFAEGATLLTRAHELAPDDAGTELALASLNYCAGDHEAARRGFHRALTLDPNLAGAHAGIGQLALLRGDAVEAERHFRTALRAGEEPQALAGIGALLIARGEHDAALRHIARAAELAPNDALIQFMLGQTFGRRGNVAFAEQAFRNALRLRPDLDVIKPWLGSALLQGGRSAEAGAVYHELLGAPGFVNAALIGIADVARVEGRLDDAISAYHDALRQQPGQVMPALALGWSLAQVGRFDEALAAYDACLAVTPDDNVHCARAELLAALGRLPEAAAELKVALARNPANLRAHGELAQISERLGDFASADAHAKLVLAAGDEPAMRLLHARTQLREGDAAGARATLDALARHPLPPPLAAQRWNLLGRAHDRAREWTDAVRCFAEAQRGLPVAMPDYTDPPARLDAVLAEATDAPWAQAPILLLGLPGSRVEEVAALLSRQAQLSVHRQRAGVQPLDDDLDLPDFDQALGEFSAAQRERVRERWLASLRAGGVATDRPVVEWLPRWDARLLALVHRAMPGTRIVVVERDPRDELLNWLAFGWAPGFRCDDPQAAAQWLAQARRHLHWGGEGADPRRLVVSADALLADPAGAGAALARFLGIAALEGEPVTPRGLGGLPQSFTAGHWRDYGDALAGAFEQLRA
ncbi:tetratricopeptide repeat protein [Dokdonella sp.]|uniref:tetratricopeptide repeat protein n=1 Tax=Dokdonella sp. TaxID=2291710 RepID=UPI003782F0BE